MALHAVQHETAHHVNAIRRAGNEVDERVGALQLQVHRHEVVRAQRARRRCSTAKVLRSTQQVSFLSQLLSLLVECVHARDDVRRHG